MIAKVTPVMGDDSYLAGVFVDSMISGVMAHLHDVSRNQAGYADPIGKSGGFTNYVKHVEELIKLTLTQLKAPEKKPVPAQSGRHPGERP